MLGSSQLAAAAVLAFLVSAPSEPSVEYSVTNMDAKLLSNPPDLKPLGKRIAYGTFVAILEQKTEAGKEYVKLRNRDGNKEILGWTAKANLGAVKEFDASMKPEDPIDVERLNSLELMMASIYNTRGKYLKEQATALEVKPSALAAIVKVESSGRAFGNDGRTIVRFENNIFRSRWGRDHAEVFAKHFKYDAKEAWKGHEYRLTDDGPWLRCHQNQTQEWEILTFARTLDDTAALMSASFGAGQIMGFNHKVVGYAEVQIMVKKFDTGIKPQLDGIISFIKAHNLCMKGLKSEDFTTFAQCYNGTGQAAAYGARIQEAVKAYRKVTGGLRYAD